MEITKPSRTHADLDSLRAFVDTRCAVSPRAIVPISTLYAAWTEWAAVHDVWAPGIRTFSGDLRTVLPMLADYRPRGADGAKLPRHYRGIALRALRSEAHR